MIENVDRKTRKRGFSIANTSDLATHPLSLRFPPQASRLFPRSARSSHQEARLAIYLYLYISRFFCEMSRDSKEKS